MKQSARLLAALALTSLTAFGADFRAVALKAPPQAVVIRSADDLAALSVPMPAAAGELLRRAQGALLGLDLPGHFLLIPERITQEAQQALAVPKAGGEPQTIAITQEMAAALSESLSAHDVDAAAQLLTSRFDGAARDAQGGGVLASAGAGLRALVEPAASVRSSGRGRRGSEEKGPPAPNGARPGQSSWERAKPLAPAIELEGSFETLDEGYEMRISHSYPGKIGVDPADLLLEDAKLYAADGRIPASAKHFYMRYFEIGDPKTAAMGQHAKAVQAVQVLQESGSAITIITDINQSAVGTFPKDELHNWDLENMTFKESGPGQALKFFLSPKKDGGLGFKLRVEDGRLVLVSGVPLFNPRDKGEKPLMHDKGYVAVGPDGKAWERAGFGTANMNATENATGGELPSFGGRYNRALRSKDPVANQVDLEWSQAAEKAFSDREGVKGIPKELDAPRRVHYRSEADRKAGVVREYREIAVTNGRQNPNERSVRVLERATQALVDAQERRRRGEKEAVPDFEIEEYILSEFVVTYTPEVDALRKWLDALKAFYPDDYWKRAKIFGVFDQQFLSPAGFGEVAVFDGMLVLRPMGKSLFPFRTEFLKMMQLFGYVRLLDGVTSIDPSAAPTKVHLWHDKTRITKVKERNPKTGETERWVYVWTRSLNDSGHFQSIESQDEYRLRPDSRLAKEFEDSIKEVVKAEPEYALPLDTAIVMEVLALATHHTRYDEGMPGYAEKFIAALKGHDHGTVGAILEEIIALPTKHANAVKGEQAKELAQWFVDALNRYAEDFKKNPRLNEMTYRKAVNLLVAMAERSARSLLTALDVLYWRPGQTPAQLEQAMRRAWTELLKMTEPYPEDHDRGPPGGQAPRVAAATRAPALASEGTVVPMSEVMAGVFDADDNLWLNVNGVWVFKKGTDHREKIRIPSEEFAHVRLDVGKSGPYAGYEYWDEPNQGSFWEFYDQPGRNPLLENLKNARRERGAGNVLKGKSADAFRRMLQVNPKGVYILTAGGLSRKSFLEALQFLKDSGELGDIAELMPAENIHCVGNPDHPYFASTGSPSKGKLLTMKNLILAPAQRRAERLRAQGRLPPLLLGPDGKRRENLMPMGFSDDDPGNVSTMRDGAKDAAGNVIEKGLAAEYAAGAWPNVKITLFDADPADPAAAHWVIMRDGRVRQTTPEDEAEIDQDQRPPAADDPR